MANPYFRTRASTLPISQLIYMAHGEKLNLKVDGLGPDGRHLVIRASPEHQLGLVVKKADDKRREQDIEITARGHGRVMLYGFNATSGATYRCMPGLSERCLPPLSIDIVSAISMPENLSAEQLALLRVLLAETIQPTAPGFDMAQAVQAMQYMRQVLFNRLAFPHPHYLDVPRNNPTLLGLIGSGRAVEGFKGYPQMTQDIIDRLGGFITSCNQGAGKHFLLYRQLFQHALAIATGQLNGPEHNPKLYGWRTLKGGSPGINFQVAMNLQGQTFYTLTPEFMADPHGNKKEKK
ncbi:hypothetical protein Z042_13290 [Chania multitudinisentens RB-25]|uniref:Uncharacterized protein n=1 Tax=Chania multitudinisentens RB-25 TaxID=1441930 RepID=W0LKD2_9GAMM|nr:hypothetical protein [Chania multitudinisentens]AHG22792.1 hypothetical protein Z042_13290 [Chania multitudinisentens RB-25]